MRRVPAPLAIALLSAAALCGPTAADTEVGFRIDHAFVPGIGRVGTTLPRDTKVRPPGRIPKANYPTDRGRDRMHAREAKLAASLHKGPDAGPPEKIARIKRDVAVDLFLRHVAFSCDPLPRAGLWVYWYAFAPPSRRVRVNNYFAERVHSKGHRRTCEDYTLKLERFQGVRVDPADGSRARLVARGRYEARKAGGRLDVARTLWKIEARRVDHRWRLAILSEEFPYDDTDSG